MHQNFDKQNKVGGSLEEIWLAVRSQTKLIFKTPDYRTGKHSELQLPDLKGKWNVR